MCRSFAEAQRSNRNTIRIETCKRNIGKGQRFVLKGLWARRQRLRICYIKVILIFRRVLITSRMFTLITNGSDIQHQHVAEGVIQSAVPAPILQTNYFSATVHDDPRCLRFHLGSQIEHHAGHRNHHTAAKPDHSVEGHCEDVAREGQWRGEEYKFRPGNNSAPVRNR